jgi:NAD(P)H-quinone oxidoreductase subunit 5
MIMQAGLGFFGAAVTHLILHGFYKAYQFLASGSRIAHEHPATSKQSGSAGLVGGGVVALTGLAGGVLFATLTGKGTSPDSGLLLTLFVVLTVLHAARDVVTRASLPAGIRYGAVPLVALPAIAVYAAVYGAVGALLGGGSSMGEPAELTAAHALVAAAFLAAYFAIESGVYRRSHRLYAALLNATSPPPETQLTSAENYNEY